MLKQIISIRLLPVISLLFIFSCKKNDITGITANHPSVVRPVGQPLDEPFFETAGPSGGIIQSPDGQITIEIPAGALTDDAEIGIQPIKNTAVSGIGDSYRITPHGKIFQKKVTIRFKYENAQRRISSSKALEIAYQNEEGEWICVGGSVNDPLEKTISVQTDHFSDWTFVESMALSPVVKTVGLNQTVNLKALRYVHPANDDDFLVPLTIPEARSGEPMLLEQKYIVKWTLDGPGRLEANGNQAVYQAPSATPGNKSAIVTVELNVHGQHVMLISSIYIVEEGIDISIDGGPWITYPAMATVIEDLNQYSLGSIRISEDIPQILFLWPAKNGQSANGIYHWSMFNNSRNNIVFEYATPDLEKIYASVYEDQNNEMRNSGGFISVEEADQNGRKYITGIFAIDNAGLVEVATGEQVGVKSIVGTFKSQRSW